MAPLVGLAVSLLPSLAKRVVDNVLPDVEAKITNKVRDVLGTNDPAEAQRKLQDEQVASELRLKLAEIEAEADKREKEMQLEKLRMELDSFKEELRDTQSARTMLTGLTERGSILAWGPVIVSTIVVTGFFAVIVMLIRGNLQIDQNNQLVFQVINIAVGALTAGFATVVSFWLGSSQGSRNKDAATLRTQTWVADLQRDSAQATSKMFAEQTKQTSELLEQVGRAKAVGSVAGKRGEKSTRQFHECVEIILRHEGGYSEHPDDPGGATNFGITHKTLAAWRKVDRCTREEVKALEVDEAKEIYRSQYWNALNCDQLPPGIDLVTFDFGVNAGVGRSARTLQEVVFVKVDGQVGPITVAAAARMDVEDVVNTFSDKRLGFYKKLRTWDTFGRGWTRRTEETRAAALRMARQPSAVA